MEAVLSARAREDWYQCLCVGKMEGFASCWTCTMYVVFFSSDAVPKESRNNRIMIREWE